MTFENNIWLIAALILLPALTVLYLQLERGKKSRLASFAASKLIEDLAASLSTRKRNLKAALLILAIVLIAISLARPRWGYDWQETKGKGIDILIALDTSKSMLAEDIRPNRLDRAKLAILDLLERIEDDRVGLIAFSGSAFLQCPLTLDYDAYRQTLETVDTNIISLGGTNMAAAIAEAQASFAQDDNFRILVLITDGEDLEAEGIEQARLAAQEKVTVYTVGVGSLSGELIPVRMEDGGVDFLRDSRGNVVKTRLDETTLTEISSSTGGFYVPLGSTGEGLEKVYNVGLQSIPKQEREARLHKIPHERFQWPLSLAVCALIMESFLSTRRRRVIRAPVALRWASMLGLALFLMTGEPVQASPRNAQDLYNEGDFEEAEKQYREAIEKSPEDSRLQFNLGATQYREGAFENAEGALVNALQTDDLELQGNTFYNLGNTHYRMGQTTLQTDPQSTIELWEEGLKDYENALNLDPADEDAKFNTEFLEKRLEELKKQLEQQQQQQQQQQNEENNEEQNQEESSQGQESEQQDEGQQQSQSEEEQSAEKESAEQESKEEQMQQTSESEETDEGEELEPQVASGRMTREEARQLLDSMKSEERKLPIAIFEIDDPKKARERTLKDW